MQPSFFIIGAPKCGTTSLTTWLSSHPDLHIPEKEIHYFNDDHRRNRLWSPSSYEALFQRDKVSGDSSVWYLYSRKAVPNILEFNPEAKFVVCLRDPVEMAFSLHNQLVFSGDEDAPDLRTAWQLERERRAGKAVRCLEPSHLFYSETCSLGSQVSRLLSHTGSVHFVFLEDLQTRAGVTFAGVLDFLDVRHVGVPLSYKNEASRRRSQTLNRAVLIATAFKYKLGLHRSLGLLRGLNEWNSVRHPWQRDPRLEKQLRIFFQDDIKLLAELTKRDLTAWLNDTDK